MWGRRMMTLAQGLTLDQLEIQRAVRDLVSDFDDEYWAERDERHEFPTAFYDVVAAGGWLGIAIPEEFGGSGLGIVEASLLLEEIAASGAGMNGCSAIHLTIFGLNVVLKHANDELRSSILRQAVDGSLHVCFAVTEPDAGSDTTRIRSWAERDGDDYIVNGRKVWITKAGESQKMVLLVRTRERSDAHPTQGMSLLLVDLDLPGIELRSIAKMGRNAVASHEVFLDQVRVPVACRIGDEGAGFSYILDGLNPERILLAHEAVGIGRAALDRAVAYSRERVVFGRPIGKNQGVAFPLAEARIRLDAARLMAREAARTYDAGLPCGPAANMAKWLCAEAGFQAADAAVQVHGGMGYAREYHVERYFREARIFRIAPVSQEMILNYVAEHVLELPRSY